MIAWGRGDYGQLGQGDCLSRNEPVKVPISKERVNDIRGGSEHNIAILGKNILMLSVKYKKNYGKDRKSSHVQEAPSKQPPKMRNIRKSF